MMSLTIKKDRTGPILGFHPWVFSHAIVSIPEGLKAGQPVKLLDEKGEFLAAGYFNSYSQIAVRIWGYDPKEVVGESFFANRIKGAYESRKRLVETPHTNAYRLINGENDFLPGLIVDKYADYLVVQFHTRGIDFWKNMIITALADILKPKGIYERSDLTFRRKDNIAEAKGLVYGVVPDTVFIKENGFSFLVDIINGQKTGFFLDQRDKRKAFMKYAGGKTVLNCFAYTGGFSVYALSGGAQRVANVDTSESALNLARENIKLNGFDTGRCEFICDDVKNYLAYTTETFDAVVLDPPAFIKDHRKKKEGILGYKKINEMAIKILSEGGILLTCSCSAHLSLNDFRYLLSETGIKTKKPMRILEIFTHGIDHAQLLPFTEGEYLKCFILKLD